MTIIHYQTMDEIHNEHKSRIHGYVLVAIKQPKTCENTVILIVDCIEIAKLHLKYAYQDEMIVKEQAMKNVMMAIM